MRSGQWLRFPYGVGPLAASFGPQSLDSRAHDSQLVLFKVEGFCRYGRRLCELAIPAPNRLHILTFLFALIVAQHLRLHLASIIVQEPRARRHHGVQRSNDFHTLSSTLNLLSAQ
jgi:hypothetical protein